MCTDKDTRHVLEVLSPEGPHEIISISAEQAAPMADLAAFTRQLVGFTAMIITKRNRMNCLYAAASSPGISTISLLPF